jgi:L-glyceraldehyde 3-phosphate reductase
MHTPDPARYDSMPYRRCGPSGLLLPALSLGLWHNFGEVDDPANARQMVLRAFDLGITHFDLANNYGPPPGSAESCFGKILTEDLSAHRDELVISTKAGHRMWPGPYGDLGSRKHLLASLDQSLRRMRLDAVDIFYSHRPDPETPLEETLGALVTAVQSGRAIYAGISGYPPHTTREIAAWMRAEGAPLLIHQPRYNLLDRRVEQGLAQVLAKESIGCIPFSPLAQGILAGRYRHAVPADSRAGRAHGFLRPEHLQEDVLRKAAALEDLARERGQSLAQMAIAWLLAKPFVTSVLIGVSSVAQIEENLGAVGGPDFCESELARIDAIVADAA